MLRREFRKMRYFIVFVITTLVFFMGIWAGQLISKDKFSQLEETQLDLRTQTITLETQFELISKNPCILLESDEFSRELYQMGQRLSFMEERYGKNNEEVLGLKEYYSLLEIRHWLFMEQIKKECEADFITILYFYSNLGDCEKCEQQGYLLTYLTEKYQGIRIYSFDVNIDNPALEILKESYKISEVPSLIIDNKVYSRFMNALNLEKHLKENGM